MNNETLNKKAEEFLAWGRGSWGQGTYCQAPYDNATMLALWTLIAEKAKAHADFLATKPPHQSN